MGVAASTDRVGLGGWDFGVCGGNTKILSERISTAELQMSGTCHRSVARFRVLVNGVITVSKFFSKLLSEIGSQTHRALEL